MIRELKAAVELNWEKEYYTVEEKEKRIFAPCVACDNTGRVKIKDEEYICPRCNGNWREKEVVGVTKVFSVGKWRIASITTECKYGKEKHKVRFERVNGGSSASSGRPWRRHNRYFSPQATRGRTETPSMPC